MKKKNPRVKLAVALLDDPNGISQEVFEALKEVLALALYDPMRPIKPDPEIEKILAAVDACGGRFFLPEDWNESSPEKT